MREIIEHRQLEKIINCLIHEIAIHHAQSENEIFEILNEYSEGMSFALNKIIVVNLN